MTALSVPILILAAVLPVGPFRSIALQNGGRVVVRHGAVQQVSVDGDPRCVTVEVDRTQLLVEPSHRDCGREHRTRVEVVTPVLTAVSVSHGGSIEVGTFPAQKSIAASVEQGGRIDIRALPADDVQASIYSGGGIFTTASSSLTASVDSGGMVTYWGDPGITKSVSNGGAVRKGRPEDARKPLPELMPGPAPVAPIPPVPPVPPM